MLILPPWAKALRTQRSKRLAVCYRIERRDGEVYRLTTHNRKLTTRAGPPPLATGEYTPVGAPSPESTRKTSGIAPETTSMFGAITLPGIAAEDLRIGLFRGAEVNAFTVDWRYPWTGPLTLSRYFVGEVGFSAEKFEIELKSLAAQADVAVGRIHNRRCDARLGDDRCTKDITLMMSGIRSVTAVSSAKRLRFQSGLTHKEDDWWTHGELTWLTGNNAIQSLNAYQVKKSYQTNGDIELWTQTPYDIEVGDTFQCEPGDNKDAQSHCRKKFDNIENHRGFPYMRGADHIIKQIDAK